MGWFLLVRAFTPLGAGLARLRDCWNRRRSEFDQGDGSGWVWGISALVAMAFLAEKLHHEYYWLSLAPVAAVGIGRALDWLAREPPGRRRSPRRRRCVLLCVASGALDLANACRMERPRGRGRRCRDDRPARCLGGRSRGAAVSGRPPRLPDGMDDAAAAHGRPASGEPSTTVEGPLELVEYYRRQGARYFADLGSRDADPRERACTTPSADDTRSLWTVPRSSSPIWPIPGCTGMPTEARAGHHS